MTAPQYKCFIASPFKPAYAFVAEWLKAELRKLDTLGFRADDSFRPSGFSDKILSKLQESDFVIADISGKNPNVMYELGLAHAFEIPVILITDDDPEAAPADIRHIEQVSYGNGALEGFRKRLRVAVRFVVAGRFAELHSRCQTLLNEFNKGKKATVGLMSSLDFVAHARQTRQLWQLGSKPDLATIVTVVLPEAAEPQLTSTQLEELRAWIRTA